MSESITLSVMSPFHTDGIGSEWMIDFFHESGTGSHRPRTVECQLHLMPQADAGQDTELYILVLDIAQLNEAQ